MSHRVAEENSLSSKCYFTPLSFFKHISQLNGVSFKQTRYTAMLFRLLFIQKPAE